ncbi:hypothetical protein PR048_006229 [Dryococelus australis]|uniref:Uncharacterized protein n=1 Tax=Dryococelus australis TaxID=614101 RepID=A0ABQ9IAD3_9NEOP|nr:hypothetical protein PR048_006229 [Dryococelus australis]
MSDSSYKRPDSVPFPSVWRRVKGKKPMGGVVPSFVIQDVPPDRHADVVDFMEANYARHEPMREGMSFWKDAVSIEELRARWEKTLRQNVSVVAFLDDGSARTQVVGANVLGVVRQGAANDTQQVSLHAQGEMVAECSS